MRVCVRVVVCVYSRVVSWRPVALAKRSSNGQGQCVLRRDTKLRRPAKRTRARQHGGLHLCTANARKLSEHACVERASLAEALNPSVVSKVPSLYLHSHAPTHIHTRTHTHTHPHPHTHTPVRSSSCRAHPHIAVCDSSEIVATPVSLEAVGMGERVSACRRQTQACLSNEGAH